MTRFQDSMLRRTISIRVFEELSSLWRQLAAMEEINGTLITQEMILAEIPNPDRSLAEEHFSLLLSSELSLLLRGTFDPTALCYQVSIIWDRQVIADFINDLKQNLAPSFILWELLTQFSLSQQISSSFLENIFITQLLNILAPDSINNSQKIYRDSGFYKLEDTMRQKIAQERLLKQIIAQIRQDLDLSSILETAVRELRSFLQVDRSVIYEFGYKKSDHLSDIKSNQNWGCVTYESKLFTKIPSLLNVAAEDNRFFYIIGYQEESRRGSIIAIEDVDQTCSSSFSLTQFFEKYWIKSELIVPIIVEETLWGLLIAHQCFEKRQWFDSEKNFLGQIGEHLAIAIYQAQLYTQVQEQKKTFEQRVIEKTKELRDALLASQAANYSKSEFLGNMSHELRTPLTCIIGLSGTLLYWSGENKSFPLHKQRQYLRTIQDSGKHLLEMINEILEFSKLEAGKYVLSIQESNLKSVAKTAYQKFKKEAKQKNIKLLLELKVKGQEENQFFADPERLQQILYHLLNNALKFTSEGGTVTLRIWREGNQGSFQVEDTGIGIAENQIPLLFESFQQLETSRQRTYGGTGLGLALTKQLVELHGGTIEVESVLEKGSIFTVRLPNQPQRQLKLSGNLERDQLFFKGNRSIVLIESNEEIATLVGELLTAANYQFIWLIDSATAVKTIELLEPTAVILDQDFTDTYQISDTLKQLSNTKSIKVLLLSHQISSTDWTDISQRGIDDYLLKPIQPNLLLKRINALMSTENNEEDDSM
ncbi:hybrid sensor histidine kinase/response regulator [cyanobacterium endosymbiont of Epithemia turgida]|uniref:hybrid sensor histidine kinase/response regulator n=1 Tax=cyanobacterium endosymbiont of Epithemia turgida TaxID=718217 RepID=UPI0004D15DEF|nr:ATP-binding protein [cyanobacterium endosymbiont of Epithemia turgida]BAP18078.1 two-component hybrid sensor and regulator [cyanobacterium endosymbiont of Epithemia turgida isolate EtSB Lake Yunoko]